MSHVKVLSVGSTLAPARENTVMPLRPKFAAAGSSVAVGLLAALLGAFPVHAQAEPLPAQPEMIASMTAAYEDALRVLQLADRQDPITELVAKKIIEVAQLGESDPVHIRDRVLKELGISPDPASIRCGPSSGNFLVSAT